VVVVTSVNRLVAARPYPAAHVEAPDPDIIMRRLATSERTMTQRRHQSVALRFNAELDGRLSTTERQSICQPRSPNLRNPDPLRRDERYRMPNAFKKERVRLTTIRK
jgi:hypothetical protein